MKILIEVKGFCDHLQSQLPKYQDFYDAKHSIHPDDNNP